MSSIDWQLGVTAFIAGSAGAYLVHRAWLALRGKVSGCGSCSACPASKPALMQIDSKQT
jgi:hypothetical protein